MIEYKINLTTAEDLALSHEAASQQEWIDNVVRNRCRIAIDDIVKIAIEKCFEQSIQVPASKEETVILAFEQDWVTSAAERNTEAEKSPLPE